VNGSQAKAEPFINVIPESQWPDGIPPVMGAHLMASGTVAPISTSKGPGIDLEPHQFQYPGEANSEVIIYATERNATNGLAKAVAEAAKAAIAAKGSFTVVLSGGGLMKMFAALADIKTDWSKWYVFWVDDRNVPHDSADSNYKGCYDSLLGKVPIPAGNIFAIQEGLPVDQAATNYEGRLLGISPEILPRTADHFPVFDLMLLGVGPDGHVASLFPNRPETAATKGWVLPVSNSPKPPPERITFTLPVINASKEVLIVAVGDSKAEIVQRILETQALPGALPAQLVRPTAGHVKWLLDSFSAQNLELEEWQNKKAFPRSQV